MGLRRRSRQLTTEIIIRENEVAQRAMIQAMMDTATVMTDTVERATGNWEHKPTFEVTFSKSGSRVIITVLPTGPKINQTIFGWVDQGTGKYGPKGRSYKIPKRVKRGQKPLRFQTGHQAKTKPIAQVTGKSGERTGPWVSAIQVEHPGIEGRKFLETAQAELRPGLDVRVTNAIRKALSRYGLGG